MVITAMKITQIDKTYIAQYEGSIYMVSIKSESMRV